MAIKITEYRDLYALLFGLSLICVGCEERSASMRLMTSAVAVSNDEFTAEAPTDEGVHPARFSPDTFAGRSCDDLSDELLFERRVLPKRRQVLLLGWVKQHR